MESPADRYLFAGTHGHVIAVDKEDGALIWEKSLPSTGYSVVVLLVEDSKLLCGTTGKLFALNPVDGEILWTNDLPGKGLGIVAMTTMHQSADGGAVVAAQHAAERRQ